MAHRRDPARPAIVRPVPVDPAGVSGPTRGQARGPGWRQSSRGFHVPAAVDASLPGQRVAEQAMRLPSGGALTGWASLHLHGATYVDGLAPDGRTLLRVPLAIGRAGHIRGAPEVHLLHEPLPPGEIVIVEGFPCTVVERAVFDAMRTAESVVEAVVIFDMAAEAGLTSLRRMWAYANAHAGWRGVPLVRAALTLASERSWSPNETRLRMGWELEAGLPRPLVNAPVFDLSGRLLGYPDLLDVESGLVGEYDGADHRHATRHSDDVRREAVFRRHGLEVTRVTGPDLRAPGRVRSRILEARARARWEPLGTRRWTVEPPEGWEAGPTLDERLDHRDFMAEIRRQWERDGPDRPVFGARSAR
jgi:hypothetical protein